jgi:hypothetical protein
VILQQLLARVKHDGDTLHNDKLKADQVCRLQVMLFLVLIVLLASSVMTTDELR